MIFEVDGIFVYDGLVKVLEGAHCSGLIEDLLVKKVLVRENTKAVGINPKRGNCRGGVKRTTIEIDETTDISQLEVVKH